MWQPEEEEERERTAIRATLYPKARLVASGFTPQPPTAPPLSPSSSSSSSSSPSSSAYPDLEETSTLRALAASLAARPRGVLAQDLSAAYLSSTLPGRVAARRRSTWRREIYLEWKRIVETYCNRALNLERVRDVYSACYLFLENRRAERFDELLRGTNLQIHRDEFGTITLGLDGAAETAYDTYEESAVVEEVGVGAAAEDLSLGIENRTILTILFRIAKLTGRPFTFAAWLLRLSTRTREGRTRWYQILRSGLSLTQSTFRRGSWGLAAGFLYQNADWAVWALELLHHLISSLLW